MENAGNGDVSDAPSGGSSTSAVQHSQRDNEKVNDEYENGRSSDDNDC
jgi:hypothetical protein